MKTLKNLLLLIALFLSVGQAVGQNYTTLFFGMKESGQDTLTYLKKNYAQSVRYNEKKIDFLFQDANRELPFKSFVIGTLGGNCICFIFMVETVDEIKKELSENRKLWGVNCQLLKYVDPECNKEFYTSLSKIGLNRLHKMDNRFIDLVKEWQIEYVYLEKATDRMKAGLN